MDRREFLRTGVAVGGAGLLAGCSAVTGLFETRSTRAPPLVENRPDAVYYPTHVEGMKMAGTAETGDFAFALMYSFPHRFWNVNGREVSKTPIEESDSVHLMASVWDRETETVLPETGLSVELTKDGELVSEEVVYPMLSQPMGVHYGANFELPGDGTYEATLEVGGVRIRRTGALRERLGASASTTVEFEHTEAATEEISFRRLDEKAGKEGAVEPMDMEMVPLSLAPGRSALPGRVVGRTTSGDAVLLATVLETPPAGVDADGPYLAVSARTPYNRFVLPAMGLSGRLVRDGEPVFEGAFRRTLDPALGYHYGAAVDGVESGDTLTLSVGTPPQIARHEGYETAFLSMPDADLIVE